MVMAMSLNQIRSSIEHSRKFSGYRQIYRHLYHSYVEILEAPDTHERYFDAADAVRFLREIGEQGFAKLRTKLSDKNLMLLCGTLENIVRYEPVMKLLLDDAFLANYSNELRKHFLSSQHVPVLVRRPKFGKTMTVIEQFHKHSKVGLAIQSRSQAVAEIIDWYTKHVQRNMPSDAESKRTFLAFMLHQFGQLTVSNSQLTRCLHDYTHCVRTFYNKVSKIDQFLYRVTVADKSVRFLPPEYGAQLLRCIELRLVIQGDGIKVARGANLYG